MPHEPINLSKTLPQPTRATRIVQEALGHFVNSRQPSLGIDPTRPLEAAYDGMLITVTRDGWMVCEDKPNGSVAAGGDPKPPAPAPKNAEAVNV